MRQKIEGIILCVTALIAIAVSIADFTGLLTWVPWLQERIPQITLLLLALFVISVAFELRGYLPGVNSKIEQSTTYIIEEINKLHGGQVRRFEDAGEVYSYVAMKLHGVSKSVDDITWGSRTPPYRTEREKKAYQDYLKGMEAVCKKKDIEYREISNLTNEHFYDRADNLIKKGYYTYNLGYYDLTDVSLPLLSYIVFDRQEVVAGFYRSSILPSAGEVYLSITHPSIVELFVDYFDTLWAGSTKIKDGTTINDTKLKEIKKKLNYDGKRSKKLNSDSKSP